MSSRMERLVGLRKRADDGTSELESDFPVIHKTDDRQSYIDNAINQDKSTKSEEELGKYYDANYGKVLGTIQIGNDLPFPVDYKYNGKGDFYRLKTNSTISGVDVSFPFAIKYSDPNDQTIHEIKIEAETLAKVAEKGIIGRNLSELSEELGKFKAKSAPKSGTGTGSPRKGGGSATQKTTSGEILINPEHRGLTGLVDPAGHYVYDTDPNGAWADFTKDGKKGKRLDSTYSGWAQFVGNINAMPVGDAKKTAPTATATPAAATPSQAPGAAATTAPVPEASTSGVQTRRVVSDAVVMGVAKVLTDVYGGATYAGRTIFRNEKGMVRKMMDQLDSTAQSLGVTIGSAEALAQIITPSIRPGLGRFGSASLDGLGEKEMEKQYRQELNLIMTAVLKLYDRVKSDLGLLLNYQPNLRDAALAANAKAKAEANARNMVDQAQVANTGASTTPAPSAPATPAAPAQEGTTSFKMPTKARSPYSFEGVPTTFSNPADDGSSFGKKSSQSSKFKKLAKLRRLRVRGQMEAAIEPSSRLGVSRVS